MMLHGGFFGILILGSAFYVYTIYKDDLNTNLKALLEALFVISISTITSLLASALFSCFQELLQISGNNEIIRRKKFMNFFNCEISGDDDDKKKDKVAVILPSFRYSDYYKTSESNNLSYAGKEDFIRDLVEKHSGKDGQFLNSIKIFFESAAISFSQSDAIAATNVVALFSKMGMRLPTIRTDLQALSKIFQYDENGNFLDEHDTFSSIQNYLGKEQLEIFGLEEEVRKIIAKRARDSRERRYTTYISIGMFSNILLMDLLNRDILGKVDKHFTCVTFLNKDHRVVRSIKIQREGHSHDSTPELFLSEKEISVDYALIARSMLGNDIIFVCAGITVVATEAAARFLSSHWEALHDSGEQTFAIVIPVPVNEHKFAFKRQDGLEWWVYPESLKQVLFS